jgi:hypothetical protein
LVQNILNPKQIIDDDWKTLTIVPWKCFWTLGLFCDHNFPMLFYGNPIPFFTCSYQKIIQVELTSTNIKFAYHITNIYF